MSAARKFILDLLFIKYSTLRWEIIARNGGKMIKRKIQLHDRAAGTSGRWKDGLSQ